MAAPLSIANEHLARPPERLGSGWFWLCQCGGWGGSVVYPLVVAAAQGVAHPVRSHFPWLVICAVGFAVTLPLHTGFRALRPRVAGWRLVVAGVLGIAFTALIGATISGASMAPLGEMLFPSGGIPPVPKSVALFNEFLWTLTGWSGLYFAITGYRERGQAMIETARLDAALKDAELRALRSQLNPHFLFNCLNLLRALMPRDAKQPREAVTLLADVLRASLTMGDHPTIPLARELETVDSYLALEQLRLGDRLHVVRSIDPAAGDCPVPPFLIQSLVENAVKFGVAAREEGGQITLDVRLAGDVLRVAVVNHGQLTGRSESTGLGLKNAELRLASLYGRRAKLALVQRTPELVVAEVELPAGVEAMAGR